MENVCKTYHIQALETFRPTLMSPKLPCSPSGGEILDTRDKVCMLMSSESCNA